MAIRRVLAAVVSFALAGCVSIPVRVRAPVAIGISVVVPQKQVLASLRSVKEKLGMAVSGFRRSRCGDGDCYAERDVTRLLGQVRDDLRKSFPKDALPLLDSVDRALATEAAGLGPLKEIDISPVKSGTKDAGYDAQAVIRTLGRMAAAIDRFLSLNELVLNLNVHTEPPDAQFAIQIPANDATRRGITTNGLLPNVWRGVYKATVSKRGFKGFAQTLDLINDGRTQIICQLKPSNAAEDSVCHVQ